MTAAKMERVALVVIGHARVLLGLVVLTEGLELVMAGAVDEPVEISRRVVGFPAVVEDRLDVMVRACCGAVDGVLVSDGAPLMRLGFSLGEPD